MNGSDEEIILDFITNNYMVDVRTLTIHDGIVDINGGIMIKRDSNLKNLTNGMFIFGEVKDFFHCNHCQTLTSLKGSPRKVKYFNCNCCFELKDLEGSPEYVTGEFNCSNTNIVNLKGAPDRVGKLDCKYCKKLISLEGISKKIRYYIDCEDCINLSSIKDIPENFTGRFYCASCHSLDLSDLDDRKIKFKIVKN